MFLKLINLEFMVNWSFPFFLSFVCLRVLNIFFEVVILIADFKMVKNNSRISDNRLN